MTTPEGVVKNKVKKILDAHGAYYYMPVPGGYGKPSLDFIGSYNGYFFAIETKAAGKHATTRQNATAQDMIRGGAAVFFIEGADSLAFNALDRWFNMCKTGVSTGFIYDNDHVIGI